MTGRPDIALFKRWGRSLIDVDKLFMTDECNYDQPLVRHQSVGLQKCWMKPVLVLSPSQSTAHCFALAHSIITLAHRLLSKRENACSLTEEWPVTMHTQGLHVSFSCNFRITYLIKPVWSWFGCLFSLTLTAGKNSNKASSSSNVDSVVGCSHISNFSQTSKRKQGLSELYCLLWTSKLIFSPMWWSSSMKPIKLAVTLLILWGCGSNQLLVTQFRSWTDFLDGNEVTCLCDQRPVSGALSNRAHGWLFHPMYFKNRPLEPG